MQTRFAVLAAAAAAALVIGSGSETVVADGVITTTGASITAGEGDTVEGDVFLEPCALPATPPVLPPLGLLPTQPGFEGALAPFAPIVLSEDIDFDASTDTMLSGDTYEFASYTVIDGATISYDGPVTLLVDGDVTLNGSIVTTANSADIVIRCSGTLRIGDLGGTPVTGVRASGGGSDVTIIARQAIETGVPVIVPLPISAPGGKGIENPPGGTSCRISAVSGAVSVIALGLSSDDESGVTLFRTEVESGTTRVQIGATDFVSLTNASLASNSGGMTVQAFGGDVTTESLRLRGALGDVLVQAGGTADLGIDSQLSAVAADLRIDALGGDLLVGGASVIDADDGSSVGFPSAGDGAIELSASNDVRFSGGTRVVSLGAGDITVRAHGRDVELEPDGSSETTFLTQQTAGNIVLDAARNVHFNGFSYIACRTGNGIIRAFAGDFAQTGKTYVSCGGDVDARASGSITAQSFEVGTAGPNPYIVGANVLLVASGDISLTTDFVTAMGSALEIFARGRVTLSGAFEGAQSLEVISHNGPIIVRGSTLTTDGDFDDDFEGDLNIETFGLRDARIDATNATIRSGDREDYAEDVSLTVHAGSTQINSFVLPKVVKIKLNEKNPEKSFFAASGFFDTGRDEVAAAGPATIQVGDLSIEANLVVKGRNFTFKNEMLKFKLKPSRAGSSRAKFRLSLKGDLQGMVPDEGPVTIRFTTQSADGSGTVSVDRGQYKLGRKRGALTAPSLFPFKVKATHKGSGKDTLQLLAGLTTDGGTPETAPDVVINYNGLIEFTIPSAEFQRKGDNYTAKSPPSAPGVRVLVLNFKKEQVTLKAAGLDLGPIPAGPEAASIHVALGDAANTVVVRMAPAGKSFKY